jgi:hypothetical protein
LFYSLSFFIILKARAINCEIWQSSMLTVSPPRTNAVGAQPRATVCNTHTIAVIDEGKVVEQDTDRSYIKMLQLQRLTSTPHGCSDSSLRTTYSNHLQPLILLFLIFVSSFTFTF